MSQHQPFDLGAPVSFTRVSAVVRSVRFCSLWVVLAGQVLTVIFFGKSLYNFLEVVVKGSRNQESRFFTVRLKSVYFMLVGPLTCHQAGLYIKQNLKLFVAYMCLIWLKVELLMLFLFNTLTSCKTQTFINSRQRSSEFIYR